MIFSSDTAKSNAHRLGMHLAGVGSFITYRSYKLAGRLIVWKAREQRKGLLRAARALEHLPAPLWQTRRYNQAMCSTFAVGSLLFIVGSALSLWQNPSSTLTTWTNLIFFFGSIPFTLAAYMQHFQAANASRFTLNPSESPTHMPMRFIGWQPHELGWLSTLTQFLGTLAFNVSTLGAVQITAPWSLLDGVVWMPEMLGSALFLVSAYLAFIEANHAMWQWHPKDLTWQIVFVNLVGCITFMAAACTAYVPATGPITWVVALSNAQLLVGATCFLVGALLSIRESRTAD